MTLYCEVKDGKIIKYNLHKPKVWNNVSFGSRATDDDYRAVGLYPIIGTEPEHNRETQRVAGVSYLFDGIHVNKIYSIVDIDIEDRQNIKREQLAALRYEKEIAGIEINGTVIRTDRETQSVLDSAHRRAKEDLDLLVDWKGANGWVKLTAAQIIAIGDAVFAYVQACFKHERELSDLIESDIDTDITIGWPNPIISNAETL